MDDPLMKKTECRSSCTIHSPMAGSSVAAIADDLVDIKKEPSWYEAAEEHDLEEENETKLHLFKSEYEVQDSWWHSEWNDVKEEYDDGRESDDNNDDLDDDDSKDGDYGGDSEDVGDCHSIDGDCVDGVCNYDEEDFDDDNKSLDPSNLLINQKQEHRAFIDRKRYCFESYILRDCPFCGMVFDSVWPWKKHMDVEHNFSKRDGSYYNYVDVNQAMCKTCNAVIRNKISALKVHVIQHLPYTKIFKCKTCSYADTVIEKIRKHIENKHFDLFHTELTELTEKKLERKCVYCNEFAGTLRKLSFHIRKEHPHTFKHKMQLVCPVCGESFPREHPWKQHLQQKHQFDTLAGISFEYIKDTASEDAKASLTYRCLNCRRTFGNTYQRYHLVNHAFKHLPHKSYKCTYCNYDCFNKEKVIAHTCENLLFEIESHPYLREKPGCSKYLPKNTKTDIIDKLYVCPSCEKEFESVTLWTEHLTQVHSFDKVENLNIQKIDEENSTHRCLICDKVFSRSHIRNFQMHAFSHMPHKWTKCKFCLKPINYCSKCSCNWKSKSVKLAPGSIAFFCPRCGKEFSAAHRWENHIVSEHNLRDPSELNFCKVNEIESDDLIFKCELCDEYINESASSCSLLFDHATSKHMQFKPYKCKNCGKSFENKSSILTHLDGCKTKVDYQLKKHLEKARCQCFVCGYLGKSNDDVAAHFSNEHPFNSVENHNFSWICVVCELKCNSKENMIEHISRKHISNQMDEDNSRIKFLCPVSSDCLAHFNSKHEWRSHISIHHAFNTDEQLGMKKIGRFWKCLECSKVIKQRWSKLTHKLIHFKDLRFQCRLCNGTYGTMKYTRRHALTCTGEQKSALFSKIKQMVRDSRKKIANQEQNSNKVNTEKAENDCHADPLIVDENTLQTSMATEKSVLLSEFEEYVTFACPECNVQLDTKTDWHAHINKNHDFFFESNLNITPTPGSNTKGTCNECGCIVHGRSQLHSQRHKLTHMPYSAFICRLCNHRSKTQNVLIYHIQRRHLTPGTFPCYFCDLVCETYVERYGHVKSQHSGVKWPKNVCEICMKKLKSPSAMEQHMTTHDFNRTTFSCGYCERKYLHSSERIRHWKSKHPEEYDVKLAEQPCAPKVESKKTSNRMKPSSSRVKKKAHSDEDSDDSTYSPIKKPKSKAKKIPKIKNSSKVENDIKKFDHEPDFDVKSKRETQDPVELMSNLAEQPVDREAETKKKCKRKKSDNITRVKEEFHSYESTDESTFPPIKIPNLIENKKRTSRNLTLRTEVKNNIYELKCEPDFNVKSEPESESEYIV